MIKWKQSVQVANENFKHLFFLIRSISVCSESMSFIELYTIQDYHQHTYTHTSLHTLAPLHVTTCNLFHEPECPQHKKIQYKNCQAPNVRANMCTLYADAETGDKLGKKTIGWKFHAVHL